MSGVNFGNIASISYLALLSKRGRLSLFDLYRNDSQTNSINAMGILSGIPNILQSCLTPSLNLFLSLHYAPNIKSTKDL